MKDLKQLIMEKAKEKQINSHFLTGIYYLSMSDLASILDQIPARPHLMPVEASFEEVCEEDARVQELEAFINKKPEMFDFYQLYKKVEELKREVSHLEGVSDGYAVAEMEDKAKIKSLQSELSALKSDYADLAEDNGKKILEIEKLKALERERWEKAAKTLGITPPKPEEK